MEKKQDLEEKIKPVVSKYKISSKEIRDCVGSVLKGFVEVSSIYPTAMRKVLSGAWNDKSSLKENAYYWGIFGPNVAFGPITVALWDAFLIYKPLIAMYGEQTVKNLLIAQIATNTGSLLYEGYRALKKHSQKQNPKEFAQ